MSLLRAIVDATTGALGYVKRSRRVAPRTARADGMVCVNLGCGLAVAPGWINVDASLNALVAGWPRPLHRILFRLSGANQYYARDEYCDLLERHDFLHHDLGHSLPFPDASVDVVYSSHFLEHLFKPEARRLLAESRRVLKPGGVIRIAVPDLAYAVSLYAKGEKEKMLESYFFVEDRSSTLARHKYMYDFGMLEALLATAGFERIVRRAYREGDAPDLAVLDNRPEETLFVEAVKPRGGAGPR